MSGSTPRVTVGMPVYNGERFLREAIEGILGQTLGDLLLVVSDNASTDGTRDICEDYAQKDRRVRYLRHETNRGSVWNFNALADAAETPLFMWHAHDDIAFPELLSACVARLDESPDAVLAYTEADLIDDSGKPVPYTPHPLEIGSPSISQRFEACLEPFHYSENVTYAVMRTPTLHATQRHGDFGGGDRALIAEFSLYGPFARIDQLLFRRRIACEVRTEEQVQRYNTGRRHPLPGREWRILRQNIRSIRRAPLSPEDRRVLYFVLLRRLFVRRSLYLDELKAIAREVLGLVD